VPTVGVVAFPARFKGRLGATWSRGQLTASANITQIGGVRDTRVSEWPKGDEMTVLDVTLAHLATPDSFGGLGFSFSILNALNKRPPVLMPNPPFFVDYDSTNYSPLGRVVSISVSKRF